MSVVWFNGAMVEGPLALDPADRGLTLGDGLFETIAVNHRMPIWLDEHLLRMTLAAVELGLPFNENLLRNGIASVLQHSANDFEVLRVTLTRGVTVRGLAADGATPSLLISLNPFDLAKQPQTVRLATSTIRRNKTAPTSRLKTLSYLDAVAAAREVSSIADDALMLNTAGHVASSTVGNIFLVMGSQLLTPRGDQGILAGVTRQKLLESHSAKEQIITLADIFSADAVFITNSLRLATPVTMLDGRTLGTRPIHDIRHKLKTLTGRI